MNRREFSRLLSLGVLASVVGCGSVQKKIIQPQQLSQSKKPEKEASLEDLLGYVHCIKNNIFIGGGKSFNQLVGTGTAFAYRRKGEHTYLLTNQHIVDYKSFPQTKGTENVISLLSLVDNAYDQNHKDDVYVESIFLSREWDLAVLKTKTNLKVFGSEMIGDSNTLKHGDQAYLASYPMGLFPFISEGKIGNPGDYPRVEQLNKQINHYLKLNKDVALVDITFNPGSSGGPLFIKRNKKYYWMGMCGTIFRNSWTENSNIAWVVKSNKIKELADYVIDHPDKIGKSYGIIEKIK